VNSASERAAESGEPSGGPHAFSRLPIRLDGTRGPFDVIGDVHGCLTELVILLGQLGYEVTEELVVIPPEDRTLVFLGDFADRGPDSVGVLRLVMAAREAGRALCVLGNHDEKLRKKLAGRNVQIKNGLDVTVAQLSTQPRAFRVKVWEFLESLRAHHVLDGGRLVVAHAGLSAPLHGRDSRRAWHFALYGDTTGEEDEYGLPVRRDWAASYDGQPLVVYGHTPVRTARWVNNTVNIDTGCVFGGQLTALRYPELQIVSVPAAGVYSTPSKPLLDVTAHT